MVAKAQQDEVMDVFIEAAYAVKVRFHLGSYHSRNWKTWLEIRFPSFADPFGRSSVDLIVKIDDCYIIKANLSRIQFSSSVRLSPITHIGNFFYFSFFAISEFSSLSDHLRSSYL